MKNYTEISTQEEMDAALSRVAGFHDSMAKEFHIVNRGWVDGDKGMMMTHRFDGRVLIQTQGQLPAIELLFIGIEALVMGDPDEYYDASGSVVHGTVKTKKISMSFDNSLQITATRVFFRDRADWIGQRARMGSEVPCEGCVPAIALEERWRQCSSCADAFEAPPDETYAICPTCWQMTELETSAA